MNHLKTSNKRRSFFLMLLITGLIVGLGTIIGSWSSQAQGGSSGDRKDGKHLFERETFGGNGRTCLTCHSHATGTVSPLDARMRHAADPRDPLFLQDGSDDGHGNGVTRMLSDATILIEIPLPPNVSLADDLGARSVILRRGIPTTLNTPALDPVLMYDGRERNLQTQALGAIRAHTQHTEEPSEIDLRRIAEFQLTDAFFTSSELMQFARGGAAPGLPQGRTDAERRGRRFFEDVPVAGDSKPGICATCHSGPMLNQTNQFLLLPLPPGSRFQNVLVSALNSAVNPVRDFLFRNPDGTTTVVRSPDPGRALITGDSRIFPFDNVEGFKIPSLRGVRLTAPYFHDNSAKTLEDVAAHYAIFFAIVTDPSVDGDPAVILTAQDQADIVAFMKLLD